jgi:hypothetical protein
LLVGLYLISADEPVGFICHPDNGINSNTPVSDVGSPTYGFDRSQNFLWANACVSSLWWGQADMKTAKDKLESRGIYFQKMGR